MESSSNQQETLLEGLDDQGFLALLLSKDIKLHAGDGQLRVNAAAGALSDELREELKRRKAGLIAFLQESSRVGDDPRKQNLGVRARRKISPAGQWTPQLQFWKTQLEGVSGFTELPFSKPRPQSLSGRTATAATTIPHEVLVALSRLGAEEQTSLEMVLLAAFCCLMRRYTEKNDLCVGLPKLRRQRREDALLEDLVENTVCLRSRATASISFRRALGETSQAVHEAYRHSGVPLTRLLGVLPVEGPEGAHPLFQVLYAADLSGLQNPALIDSGANASFPYDLALYLEPDVAATGGLHLRYQNDLFTEESVAQFLQSFAALLHAVSIHPDAPVAQADLLGAVLRQRVLEEWNATEMEFPRDATIHSLFEARAAELPQAVALVRDNQSLTYEELNRQANQLAHFLLQRQIPRGSCIGLCMGRSVEMIVAMLAVLKAGYAYLPLDRVYPAQRLLEMLEDSGAALILADTKVLEPLAINEQQIMRLDLDAAAIRTMPDSNPSITANPDDLAYVIYTSGSTGRPKGVAIEHHSTISLLTWAASVFSAAELARVFAATSICFDLSVYEIFLPLTVGGTVLLAEDFLELAQQGHTLQPTLLNTVPSAMSSYLASAQIPESVLCINLAGEPLPESLVQQIQKAAPQARIYDLYGPTETTTYSTFALRGGGGPPTIGRPIANTKIFLLDSNLEPVPPEVAGQLYIGGEGVAREYLYRPQLTSERFVRIPGLSYQGRLYATGDLARYRFNGDIEYLGRMDNQVKIRGFRVEIGEIEARLQQHPWVRQAAVVLRRDLVEQGSLVAFVTTSAGPLDAAELVSFQQKFLPAYMVVQHIVFKESLPTTLNGKIDRKILASQPLEVLTPAAPEVPAPASRLEQDLLQIWEKHFKRAPIGLDDDFFALGGHSLLAFQIFSEIEKTLSTSLKLSVLFQAPTIRLLAEQIERKGHAEKQYALR